MKSLLSLLLCLVFFSEQSLAQDHMVDFVSRGINSARSSFGLAPVSRDAKLDLAARSQAEWMLRNSKMDHLREPPKSLDEYMVCEYHPANRVVKSGYFSFDDLFAISYNAYGAEVKPKPEANSCVGEIIAAGRGEDSDLRRPNLILEGWMKSPGHRQAILTPHFVEFGVGVSLAPGQVYWCVVFASREKR